MNQVNRHPFSVLAHLGFLAGYRSDRYSDREIDQVIDAGLAVPFDTNLKPFLTAISDLELKAATLDQIVNEFYQNRAEQIDFEFLNNFVTSADSLLTLVLAITTERRISKSEMGAFIKSSLEFSQPTPT